MTVGLPYKLYLGTRADGRTIVTVVEDEQERPLEHDQRHSEAFEWGYSGSGPTDLARAILADHLGWPAPIELYEAFRDDVIAQLPHESWAISTSIITSSLGSRLYKKDPVR